MTQPPDDAALVARIKAAIKQTEYKYFGDYEMSDGQREAVDTLVEFAAAQADLFTWLSSNRRMSLAFHGPVYGDDDDQTEEWRVTKEVGSINDREWEVVGRGETPLAALVDARAALEPSDKGVG